MRFVASPADCFHYLVDLLRGGAFFLNRVGGSDTNAVALNLLFETQGRSLDHPAVHDKRRIAKEKNGYYDIDDLFQTYLDYGRLLLRSYQSNENLVFCNHQLLRMYFPDEVPRNVALPPITNESELRLLVDSVAAEPPPKTVLAYWFVENVVSQPHTMFRAFERELIGKKVLVVSPFERSIAANFHNRERFFKNYRYPEFTLCQVNTPITYAGLPPEFYPDRNWFATVERLKRLVAEQTFDVALLSCGSYAVPLGDFIHKNLGRQSIYVGGVLQLFFGIMGRRYEGGFFQRQINRESFILPLEREDVLKYTNVQPGAPTEAFGAYF